LPKPKAPVLLVGWCSPEAPALEASPDLAAWRNSHPGEHLKNAAYGNEYETQGLWCAASVAGFTFPGGIQVTRQALFYPPSTILPLHQGADLVRRCRLLALWYEVANPPNSGELVKSVSTDLNASLGPPVEPPRFKRGGDWGSGYWNPWLVWDRSNRRIVLAVDPGGPIPQAGQATRLLVIARSSLAPRGLSFDWSGQPPKGQPSLNGPALKVPGSEAARVARFERPCSFDDGRNNWESGMIRAGEKLLLDFPASRWQPYIHLTLTRAYAAKLTLTYPGIELDGASKPTNPDELRRGALAHFKAFLEADTNSPDAAAARREAWRLLAGLPPSPIHFACTD
jgi:hypothetical protein